MASITLFEAAKLAANNGEMQRAGVIRTFAEGSPLLAAMPFTTIQGNSLAYNLQGALPGIAFRGVNESYTPSTGVINPQNEALRIVGGEVTVDTALVNSLGMSVRASHEQMKLQAMAQSVSYNIIKGNSTTDPRQFDGLQVRLTGNQLVSAGSGSGGTALSMTILDQAIDACEGATHLLMTKNLKRRITTYLRGSASMSVTQDQWGRQVSSYQGLPILLADDLGTTACVTEDETPTGGGSGGTSIYVLHLEEGWLSGIQNGPMRVTDLGELQASPAYGTRVEWLISIVLMHPRAAVRLYNIDADGTVAA